MAETCHLKIAPASFRIFAPNRKSLAKFQFGPISERYRQSWANVARHRELMVYRKRLVARKVA
jgi:hypothetical protein